MKILVTGFKPFLSHKVNPSEVLSIEMSNKFSEVTSLILPVEFKKSFSVLRSHLAKNDYQYVIMLGLAAGRSKVSFEKIALNWVQTKNKDEAGKQPKTGFIKKNKSLALMSMFPVDEVCTRLKKKNLPIEISFSAGTFVCNDLYYRTLTEYKDLKAVFIHVPNISQIDIKTQGRVLDQIIKAIV